MPQELMPAPLEHGRAVSNWRAITLYLLTGVGVSLCFLFVHVLLFPVVGAITLAVVLNAPCRWLEKRVRPAVSASLLLLLLCLAVLLPCFFLVRSVVGEVMALIHFVQSGEASAAFHQLTERHKEVGGTLQRIVNQLAPEQASRHLAGNAAVWLGRALSGVVNGFTQIVLMLFFLFFLLRDNSSAHRSLAALIPLGPEETTSFLTRLGDLTNAVFLGRFVIAAIQGALAGLAYWLLGVPGSLLWALITAICCLIPAFGSFIAWVPIALYLGLADSWVKALILTLWGGIVVGNIDNVLYPILVGNRTNMHTAVIFVAIFGGLGLFGLSGFVLGPVLVAATMILLETWKKRLGTEHGALGSEGK